MVETHVHNGIAQPKNKLKDLEIQKSETIADPSGGATVDSQARTAINAILDLLQEQGFMK